MLYFPCSGQDAMTTGSGKLGTPCNLPHCMFNPSHVVFNFYLFPFHILEFQWHSAATFQIENSLSLGNLCCVNACIVNNNFFKKKEIRAFHG